MKQELLSGHESAAHGARLGRAEVCPNFPAPQSAGIAKSLEKMHKCDIYDTDSQSSAVTAAVAASLSEKRVFLPVSGVKALEDFRTASSLRAPVVAAYSGPNGFFALRDSGWLMLMPESNQETLDTIIQCYIVSEDRKVLLPSIVSIDMHIREPVSVPSDRIVENMVPRLKLPRKISAKESAVFDFEERDNEQIQKAMQNSLKVLQKTGEKWKAKFKRELPLAENFMLEGAEYVFVIAGYNAGTARAAVRKLREQGEKAGMLRLRVLRPWPADEIAELLQNAGKIAVIDQSVSLGASGVLHMHVNVQGHVSSFIAQRRMSEKDFFDIFARLKKQEKPERVWL